MINIFKICSAIENKLITISNNDFDFKIYLRKNENLYVYILEKKQIDKLEINKLIQDIYSEVEIEYISEIDYENDNFYQSIFQSKLTINIENGRRRFNSLLNIDHSKTRDNSCPIVTFYSYKGGMGRSTTLAAFAMHLALNENKKVFIIDADFEAPGFTNFFLKNSRDENQKQGFVEYFLDKQNNFSNKKNLEGYTWEVDNIFSGGGNIKVMPAGNLDFNQETNDFLNHNLNHYVEGLSRIDFTNEDYIEEQFNGIIEDINESFKPDVILIDSRTGFSDVMGITAFKLSKIVVGFFRNDSQSLPGLNFFLQNMIKDIEKEPFLINSILPSSPSTKRKIFNGFKEDIDNIIEKIIEESDLSFPCFPISRNESLELIGSTSENIEDFIELIKQKEIKDYKDIFESIFERLNKLNAEKDIENVEKNQYQEENQYEEEITENDNVISVESEYSNSEKVLEKALGKDAINRLTPEEKLTYIAKLKDKILNSTSQKIQETSLYAENTSIEQEFDNKQFFYRNCMNDLFNIDKPIILGSKGTGKSYIYNALKSKKIAGYLKDRANKTDNYTFIYTIDKKDRIFKVNRFDSTTSKNFQNRFWLIYTWQIVAKEIKDLGFKFNPEIERFDIRDDERTTLVFQNKISDDNYIIAIEKEFERLDSYFIEKGGDQKQFLTILYDQLDEIVDPIIWDIWLPSLIDFWRYKRYDRIFGKLFVRKDLFKRLYGLTNINDIENQAINIEWSQEEMFSYFFKIVFSDGISDYFWDIMYLYQDIHYELVKKNRHQYNKLEQTSLDETLLRPLATTFFGKEVDVNATNRMGESYDWFFKNLKNADETISLRPFVDMLNFSIETWKKGKYREEEGLKPILFQKYYTDNDVRKNAVDRHFSDIVRNEIGNKPIDLIFSYIDNHEKYRRITLYKAIFNELLNNVIQENKENKEMQNQSVNSLEALLITNGIVKKENHGRGDEYKFAFLYKYRLGLRGN